MSKIKNLFNNKTSLYLIGLFPISLLIGTLISEILIFTLILFFLLEVIINKNLEPFKNNFFIFLIVIWFYLIFNLIISTNVDLSLARSISFIRFPLLILAINYFVKTNNFESSIIFKLWALTMGIIIFDLYFQYIFGYNTLGFESPWKSRLSGFMQDELKIAHLLIGFTMPVFGFYLFKDKNKLFIFFLILIYLIILILTNERSNIIKGFFIILFFLTFYNKTTIKSKILIILTGLIVMLSLLSFNKNIHQRFWTELKVMNDNTKENTLFNFIRKTNYGPHYIVGLEIFKNNKFFGSGLKTFRIQCQSVSFNNHHPNPKYHSRYGCTTHPHQLYIEFLSEIGLVGFTLFFTFFFYLLKKGIKVYIKSKDIILLSAILFFISQLIPILPSGSFFTSFSATIFWINISIIITKINEYE